MDNLLDYHITSLFVAENYTTYEVIKLANSIDSN